MYDYTVSGNLILNEFNFLSIRELRLMVSMPTVQWEPTRHAHEWSFRATDIFNSNIEALETAQCQFLPSLLANSRVEEKECWRVNEAFLSV